MQDSGELAPDDSGALYFRCAPKVNELEVVGQFQPERPFALVEMKSTIHEVHTKPHEEGFCFVTLRVISWIVRCHRNKRTSN